MSTASPADLFDYVIVGAGSAGCVVAERLSRDPRIRVALIEAGGDERKFWKALPVGYGRLFHDPVSNWRLTTQPCPSLDGRAGYWPRGKALGGSSCINALVWMRGLPNDWDRWAHLGLTGWSSEDVAPYFTAVEAAMAANQPNQAFPTDVSDRLHPLNQAFLAASQSLGLAFEADLNAPTLVEGVGPYRIATRNGRRRSAYDAFIRPYLTHRRNLKVVRNSAVDRVLFDGLRATGIRLSNGRAMQASCRVVLCAGAVASPALLQRSGVGPARLLSQTGIDIVRDAGPVGENLQDHLAITYYFRSKEPSLNEELHDWPGRLKAGLRYLATRKGPLSLSINQLGGMVRADQQAAFADTQLYMTPASYSTADPAAKSVNFDPFPGLLMSAQPNRPHSRGRIQIASAAADTPPRIDAPGLSDARDEAQAIAAVGFLKRLAETDALQEVIQAALGPDPRTLAGEDALRDFRARAATVYHPVGTCTMGASADSSVVDRDASVWDVERLSVIDASLFPLIPSANTNAPTMALAAKAAERLVALDQRA